MKKISRFFRLSYSDKRILIEVFIVLGVASICFKCFEFKKIAPHLGNYMKESTEKNNEMECKKIAKIKWAIQVMSRYTLWDSKCMVQGIAAKIMLRRRKIKSTLYLGVANDNRQGFIAHAWVRSGNVIVTGAQGKDVFTIVSIFGDKS